ncbi:MAG TPA: VOC family protein [Terriglobia bacterium]|nr:VOC family protein [Terriglobia bacterium]
MKIRESKSSLWLLTLGFTLTLVPGITARGAAPGKSQASPPPITGIAHVAFLTSNMGAARHFYSGVLGFDEVLHLRDAKTGVEKTLFKVNDHQYIEISPGLKSPSEDRLIKIAFETLDARSLWRLLHKEGVPGLSAAGRTRVGDIGFTVKDPEGHLLEFVQYLPSSELGRYFGKDLSIRRISTHIIHAGVMVRSRAAEDRFYRDDLGFRLMWYGGMNDQETDWVDMRVPNGSNWLEYMLNVHNPLPHTLGVMHHFSLGVPSVAAAYQEVLKRGYAAHKPQIGRDGKWQLNLYDPDGTRVELMEPKPVRKPCCSPFLLP